MILLWSYKQPNKSSQRNKKRSEILVLILYKIRMERSQRSNYSRTHQTQQELHSSRASSFMFGSQQSMHLGRSAPRQQESEASNRLVLPESLNNTTPSKPLTFEDQLQNQSLWLTSNFQGQKVFHHFLQKLQAKQKLLNEAIYYILQHRRNLQDCKMKVCMFYLTYIYYYFLRNHERMLNCQFKDQQLTMLKTTCSFARLKNIIDVKYETLQNCNYDGKVTILQILAKSRKDRLRDLKNIVRYIGPNIHLVKEADMVSGLKRVAQQMFRDNAENVENAYQNMQLNTLLSQFSNFLLANQIILEPPIEIYLQIFES